MYIRIDNHDHPEIAYYIIDTSCELNHPSIPSGYCFAFKKKYVNDFEIIEGERFNEIFSNNMLYFKITLFNNIFDPPPYEFKAKIRDLFYLTFDNVMKDEYGKINFNKNIMNFFQLSDNYYTKIECDNNLLDISNNITILENKLEELNLVSKKSEIILELQDLEMKINSLLS